MTDTDKLAEPSPKAGGELADQLERRRDDRRGLRGNDGHWHIPVRDDELAACIAALRTPEQPDRNAVLEEAAKTARGTSIWGVDKAGVRDRIAQRILALKEPT